MRRWWRTLVPHAGALGLVVIAVAVLVASCLIVPRLLETVADRRLDAALGPGEDAAAVTLSAELDGFALGADTIADIGETLATYPDTVDPPLRAALGEPAWVLTFPDVTAVAADGTLVRVRLGTAPVMQAGAVVIEGRAPRPWTLGEAVEVVLEQSVAARMGAVVGTTWNGPDGAIVVSGLLADDDSGPVAQDFFHRAESDRVNGADLVTGGAYIDPASVAALGPTLARAQFVADVPVGGAGLGARDVADLERAANKTAAQGTTLRSGYPVTVSTRLPALLAGLVGAQDALVSLTALIAAAPLASALLVAALAVSVVERRRARERVLRSARGESTWRLQLGAARDAAIPIAAGALLGGAAAVSSTPDAASPGIVPVLAVVICGVALAATVARRTVVASVVPPVLRVVAEIAMLALTLVAFALLVSRGLPPAGVDPLLSGVVVLAAVTAGLILARLLGWGLAPALRASHRRAGVAGVLAVARIARGSGRVLLITGVTIAVATITLALGLTQVAGDGLVAAAHRFVGADIRACGDAAATSDLVARQPAGATAMVEVRRLAGIPVTGEGRLRAVTVLSAPTVDLHRVRGDVPVLDAGTPASAVVSRSAAELLDGDVMIGGIAVAQTAVVDDDVLPSGGSAWILLDRRDAADLTTASDTACVLVNAGEVAPVAAVVRQGHPDLDVVDVASDLENRKAAPTVTTLAILLAGAGAVALAGAVAISAATEVAAARERRRTAAVLRMIGAGRPRGVVALEVGPLAAVAALGGWGVGWIGVVVVAGAGGSAERLGIVAPVSPAAVALTAAAATGVVAVIVATAVVVATGSGWSARRVALMRERS